MKKRVPISAKAVGLLRANPSVIAFSEKLMDQLKAGKPTGKKAIRAYVERKLPQSKVPKGQLLPRQIDKIPVDVVELGKGSLDQAVADHRARQRPLQGGISVGIGGQGGDGTLGYFMKDKAPPPPGRKAQWYILSCAHVLHGTTGATIIQPGPGADHGTSPADDVGHETSYTFHPVDAALALIDAGAVSQVLELFPPIGVKAPKDGMKVSKSGRTTGVTKGEIIDDSVEQKDVEYTDPGSHPATHFYRSFQHCILIESATEDFAQGGDSGSVVMDPEDHKAVGMHFYGYHLAGHHRICLSLRMDTVVAQFPNQVLVGAGESYP